MTGSVSYRAAGIGHNRGLSRVGLLVNGHMGWAIHGHVGFELEFIAYRQAGRRGTSKCDVD